MNEILTPKHLRRRNLKINKFHFSPLKKKQLTLKLLRTTNDKILIVIEAKISTQSAKFNAFVRAGLWNFSLSRCEFERGIVKGRLSTSTKYIARLAKVFPTFMLILALMFS